MMRIATEAFLEVDANLRPEGRQGALVRTLDVHVSYYRRWARIPQIKSFVDGVTAAATGAIAGATYVLGRRAIIDIPTIVIFAITTLVRSVRIVPQQRMDVVERLGKYKRTLSPGLNLLVRFGDAVRTKVDMREQVV